MSPPHTHTLERARHPLNIWSHLLPCRLIIPHKCCQYLFTSICYVLLFFEDSSRPINPSTPLRCLTKVALEFDMNPASVFLNRSSVCFNWIYSSDQSGQPRRLKVARVTATHPPLSPTLLYLRPGSVLCTQLNLLRPSPPWYRTCTLAHRLHIPLCCLIHFF